MLRMYLVQRWYGLRMIPAALALRGVRDAGKKDILKLCVAMRQREWMEGLWERSKTFEMPARFTPVFTPT